MNIFKQVDDRYGIDPDEITPSLPESEVAIPELRISIPLVDLMMALFNRLYAIVPNSAGACALR